MKISKKYNDPEIIVSEIRGMLKTFSWLNTIQYESFVFDVLLLPNIQTVEDGIVFFQEESFSNGYSLKLKQQTQLKYNITTFKKILSNWLFGYQMGLSGDGKYFKKLKNNYIKSNNHHNFEVIEKIYSKISNIERFNKLLEIRYDTRKEFYEVAYNDYILLGNTHSLYLHFGVSD